MTVCLDTNVLIQARASSHPYGVILDGFVFGLLKWAVSNRVLSEYEEIISNKAGGGRLGYHVSPDRADRHVGKPDFN
jgi:predicted nucleic acid-binding protein